MQNQIRDFRFPDLNKITLLHLSLRSSIQCLRNGKTAQLGWAARCGRRPRLCILWHLLQNQIAGFFGLKWAKKKHQSNIWKTNDLYLYDSICISILGSIGWEWCCWRKLSRYKQTSGMRAEKFSVLSGQGLWFHWFHARNWCFAEQWCRWKFHAWCLIVFEIFWHKKRTVQWSNICWCGWSFPIGYHKNKKTIKSLHSLPASYRYDQHLLLLLVGGFNPSEKYVNGKELFPIYDGT